MTAIGLPSELQNFSGRIVDVDSHEMMPVQVWRDHFGDSVEPLIEAWSSLGTSDQQDKNHPYAPGYAGDIAPIGADVFNVKGCRAPGAVLPERRLEVMDALGIDRQLMFPTGVGLYAFLMHGHKGFLRKIESNRESLCRDWIEKYNNWGVKAARISGRLRPVLPLVGETPNELVRNAQSLIGDGIRALWLNSARMPGGRSPAHPDLDPLWSLLAASRCVATLHVGTEGQFFETRGWMDAPAFEGYRSLSEFAVDPWSLSVLHLPCQNFLATMVNGGVFERHPELRFGVIEVGAWWLGPLLEQLDMGHTQFAAFAPGVKYRLPQLPSYYMRRNVRVSTFSFEEVGKYIDQYKGIEDMLCFATDYPHVEGGRNTFMLMYDRLKRHGERILEKFYVTNGQLLLPD